MPQFTVNNMTKFSHNRKVVGVQNGDTISDHRSQLLTWLSPLNPGSRHQDIQERRVNDIGEWLLETEEFRKWHAGSDGGDESAVLFCYGDPGVGKTFISSLVVDKLCDQTSSQNTSVSCFYLDFAVRNEQSATNVLGSLLKQIIGEMERIPEGVLRTFQQQNKTIGGRRPQLVNIVKMLHLITSSRRTFICLDALDECSGVQQVRLLDALKEIVEKSPDTRIFATGRPHIQAEIEKRLAGHVKSVSVSSTTKDITKFLQVKLHEDQTPQAMDESLEADILDKIPENAPEMFRLVSLNIEAIMRETTIYRRRERLNKMIDGLGWEDAYGMTIERIMAQDADKSRLGIAALMWLSHAERPLAVDELCHALAIELGSKDFNAGNAPSILTLVGCCQGLITMDKEPLAVRLIHHTVKEYLSARPEIFRRPHSAMAETCLTYLNSEQVKALSADPSAVLDDHPFLAYCSLHWGDHARRELSNYARSLALELCQEYDSHISSRLLLEKADNLYSTDFDNDTVYDSGNYVGTEFGSEFGSDFGSDIGSDFSDHSSPFSGLHCASFFGIVKVVSALIGMKCCDINWRDEKGSTPLAWAARNGHEGVVKMLLGRSEVHPDWRDCSTMTPLLYAAWEGREEVVKLLIGHREVNPDKTDSCKKTPLMYAAWKGHEGIVKALLEEKAVDPDMSDNSGQTPLTYAASRGHEEVVKLLLEREDVSPDIRSNLGRTPLLYAARGGHELVVKILLGREEINPDKPDWRGSAPLAYAAENGYEGLVKILLDRAEVNPDRRNELGQTPLSLAAQRGHEGVVKMLLERQEVNSGEPDSCRRTPLWYAASGGHVEVVKMLLRRAEVKPDKSDVCRTTPLSCAARNGHEAIVKILLGREEVNPDEPDDYGRAPLSHAAEHGYRRIVKILLGRAEVSPDKPGKHGETPLRYAAGHGHVGVVKLLLGLEEVNPDHSDNFGNTPLTCAAGRGDVGIVKLLLGLEEVSPDKPDRGGQTPLSRAARGGHEAVVKVLLGRKEVNPDKPDNRDQTPLSYAAEYRREGVVKMLLEREEVKPDKPDHSGRTPLSYAASCWCEGVVEMLLSREEVAPEKPDKNGRTPLWYASRSGCEAIANMLRARGEVNPNSPDNQGTNTTHAGISEEL